MRSLNARNVQGVMNVVTGSMTLINTDVHALLGMGYLMEMLGKPIKREMCCGPDGLSMRLKLGWSLLNFHVNDIYHGDPRISNALLDDRDEVVWADWLLSARYSTRKNDIETLVKSIYGQDIMSEVWQFVKAYIEAEDTEAMKNALIQIMGVTPQEM